MRKAHREDGEVPERASLFSWKGAKMLEIINTTTQTVAAGGKVEFTSATIRDRLGRIVYNTASDSVVVNSPGIYRMDVVLNLANTTDAAIVTTIQLQANGSAVAGAAAQVTVPATGYAQAVISKTFRVIPAATGTRLALSLVSTTGATVDAAIADVFKRV